MCILDQLHPTRIPYYGLHGEPLKWPGTRAKSLNWPATCIAQVDEIKRIFEIQPKFFVIIVIGIPDHLELGLMYVYYKNYHLHVMVILRLLKTKISKHLKGRSVPPVGDVFADAKDFVVFLFLDTFSIHSVPAVGDVFADAKDFVVSRKRRDDQIP